MHKSTIKFQWNIVANFIGQLWISGINLLFIPLYIKYLGIESYGLIGILAVLQAWLALLDMGMTPALSREVARYTGGAYNLQSINDILKSIVTIAIVIGFLVSLGIFLSSSWLAIHWLKVEKIPLSKVASAFTIMGVVTGLRFIESIYRNVVVGLQKQVLLNLVTGILETIRCIGAIVILVYVSPTINAFFIWQGLISLITVFIFAIIARKMIPSPPMPSKFSFKVLRGIKDFAFGIMMITILSLLLTQIDKMLLSHFLTLEQFGNYSLAFVVANSIMRVSGPVTAAVYPYLTSLHTKGDMDKLVDTYHNSSQILSVLIGSIAVFLIVYSDVILKLWTKNPALAEKIAPLVSIMTIGVLLNGLMQLPGLLQYVYNWTGLTIRINIVAICLIIPALLFIVPRYGAMGAAIIWVILNFGYITLGIYFMHKKILKGEKWRWYIDDIIKPIFSALTVVLLTRKFFTYDSSLVTQLISLGVVLTFTFSAAVIATPVTRNRALRLLKGSISRQKDNLY